MIMKNSIENRVGRNKRMNKNDEEYENGRNDRINQEYRIKQKGMIE